MTHPATTTPGVSDALTRLSDDSGMETWEAIVQVINGTELALLLQPLDAMGLDRNAQEQIWDLWVDSDLDAHRVTSELGVQYVYGDVALENIGEGLDPTEVLAQFADDGTGPVY